MARVQVTICSHFSFSQLTFACSLFPPFSNICFLFRRSQSNYVTVQILREMVDRRNNLCISVWVLLSRDFYTKINVTQK